MHNTTTKFMGILLESLLILCLVSCDDNICHNGHYGVTVINNSDIPIMVVNGTARLLAKEGDTVFCELEGHRDCMEGIMEYCANGGTMPSWYYVINICDTTNTVLDSVDLFDLGIQKLSQMNYTIRYPFTFVRPHVR